MAKITLKRVIDSSGNVAELFPTTTLDQIISEGTGVAGADESLSSFLTSTYIPLTQRAAALGVATLNGDGKVPFAQLPSSVTGGMKFVGTIDASAGNTEANAVGLSTLFDELTYANFATTAPELVGSYRVVTDSGWIKNSAGTINTTAYFEFRVGSEGASTLDDAIGEEGDNTSPIYLEKGDWIVFTARRNPTSGVNYYVFSIINNTYQNATATVKGVVELSDAANTSELSGDEVITESVLDGLIGAIGDANKLAPAAHNHDNVYYTETEIGNILGGSTAVTGYNKTNWDTAYDNHITGIGVSGSNGLITLTQQDGGTITANITGSSLDFGSNNLTANKFVFKNDLDGANESPLWSLVEFDNQPSVESFDGASTVRSAIVTASNLVTKATEADFEKIFYLASGVANTDTTVGSIIIQID